MYELFSHFRNMFISEENLVRRMPNIALRV
jgi:hypothetical protein